MVSVFWCSSFLCVVFSQWTQARALPASVCLTVCFFCHCFERCFGGWPCVPCALVLSRHWFWLACTLYSQKSAVPLVLSPLCGMWLFPLKLLRAHVSWFLMQRRAVLFMFLVLGVCWALWVCGFIVSTNSWLLFFQIILFPSLSLLETPLSFLWGCLKCHPARWCPGPSLSFWALSVTVFLSSLLFFCDVYCDTHSFFFFFFFYF